MGQTHDLHDFLTRLPLLFPHLDEEKLAQMTAMAVLNAKLQGIDDTSKKALTFAAKVELDNVSFKQSIDFLKNKIEIDTAHWYDTVGKAHNTGFMVAGAAKADVLADMHTAPLTKPLKRVARYKTFVKTLMRSLLKRVGNITDHGIGAPKSSTTPICAPLTWRENGNNFNKIRNSTLI
jgi:hypothetical protein